jgi:hypothetical protein
LDNEASDARKQYIRQQQIQFELVPPGNHRCNQAERAIQTFKAHFIASWQVLTTSSPSPSGAISSNQQNSP